jgi:thiol-disulfide isomerase/thioredoxin
MKSFVFIFLCLGVIFYSFKTMTKDRIITYDEKHNKVIKGLISFEELQRDSAFSWFNKEFNAYRPNGLAISQLKASGREDEIVIFAGTWCGDTKEQLPRFYRILQDANFPMHHVVMHGVDHKKHAIAREDKKFKIERIPTFIILRNGKEIGRIVESPVKSLEEDWVQYDETFERNQY